MFYKVVRKSVSAYIYNTTNHEISQCFFGKKYEKYIEFKKGLLYNDIEKENV